MHHVSGPVGQTGGPKTKSFQGEKFETGGFNIFQGKISILKGTAMRAEKRRFFADTPSEGFSATGFWTCRQNGWLEKKSFTGKDI